jgi:SagB-type dehydrogenase family enzyme
MSTAASNSVISLPEIKTEGRISLEKILHKRRSVRRYGDLSLDLSEISQLLWAAQGITDPRGLRTTPSAGALYPLEIYLAAGKVDDLRTGIHKYLIRSHELLETAAVNSRSALMRAALGQRSLKSAPAVLIVCAVYERMTIKYGERGIRYVHMEAGHAAQNIGLQAVALGLSTVVIGAFHDTEVKKVVATAEDEQPLYLIPVGRPR